MRSLEVNKVHYGLCENGEQWRKNEKECRISLKLARFENSLFFLPVDVFVRCSVQIHIIQNYFPDMKMALPFYPVAKPFLQGKRPGGRSYGNEHE